MTSAIASLTAADLDETSLAEVAAWLDLITDDGVVDLFAGPGGWDQALAELSPDVHDRTLGIEWDDDAVATRRAAGHRTAQADVAAFPAEALAGLIDGLIGSPPCQAFSLAGRQAGTKAIDRLIAHVAACADGWTPPPGDLCTDDVRADLTLEPLRWALTLRPRWIALEQVPRVLPLWRAIAEVLELHGYSTWVGKLVAADYGVPQTRQRAVLIARRDGHTAQPPETTHYDARRGDAMLGTPWVTMAEALGWEPGVLVDRRQTGAPKVSADANPSPTVTSTALAKGVWTFERPATTIIGSSGGKVATPGHRCMSDDCCGKGPRRHFTEDAITVTVSEAGVLQSFPADYPWQGSKTSRYRQVGNAVPVGLAAAILAPLIAAP